MKRGYRALREAEQELDDAADWYARKRQGLDERLFETYEEAIELALSMPRTGSMIADLPVDCEVRRFLATLGSSNRRRNSIAISRR